MGYTVRFSVLVLAMAMNLLLELYFVVVLHSYAVEGNKLQKETELEAVKMRYF